MDHDESFGRYVVSSYPVLLRRARLLVGDRGHAEDLVQASLAAAYTRWRRIETPDAYLRTVMVRKAINWKSRRWRGELPTEDLPEAAGPDAMSAADVSGLVRAALMALPPDQRAVVVMRYFDDCSEADIAEALGCSPGTVKSRASRALAALRQGGLLDDTGWRVQPPAEPITREAG